MVKINSPAMVMVYKYPLWLDVITKQDDVTIMCVNLCVIIALRAHDYITGVNSHMGMPLPQSHADQGKRGRTFYK